MTKFALILSLSLCACAGACAEVFRAHAFHGGHRWSHARHVHGWPARTSISFYSSDYGWGGPVPYAYGGYPIYPSTYIEPVGTSRAGAGLFWGGLLGAILGHNSGSLGHNAWRGAAYGAGVGYLLGAIGDSEAREHDGVRAVPQPRIPDESVAGEPAPAPTAPPSVRTRPPATNAMSAANALFGRE